MILISSHLDRVVQDFDLSYKNGEMKGLLDNILGVFLSYSILLDDKNLIEMEKNGEISIWHGKGEEWGRLINAPKLSKNDVVVVVDVADGPGYENKDFSIENISGFKDSEIKALKETMEWEGFNVKIKKYTGEKLDEDEAWKWREKGIKVVSFIIPIKCKDEGWHRIQMDNTISIEKIKTCSQGLKRLINFLY